MSKLENNHAIILITIGSVIVFTFISWVVIVVFQHRSFTSIFFEGQPLLLQLGIGILTGSIAALLLLYFPGFSSVRKFAEEMIGQHMNPKKGEIPLIAISTGIGEELLFRVVIQPFIGIWLTSLLFAVSHGGFDLKKRYMISFNIFLFVMSVIMGVLYSLFGLISSIVAHTIYNIVIMMYIQLKK